MQKEVNRQLSRVRRREALNELGEILRKLVLICGIAAILAVCVHRLLAVRVWREDLVVWVCGGLGVLTIVWLWMRFPSRRHVSVLFDERLGLKERMSSLLVLETSEDVFARAACLEATEKIRQADIRGHFPVRLSKRWGYSFGLWAVVGLLIAFLPQADLLGYLRKEEERLQRAVEIAQAEKMVELSAGAVKLAVRQLGDASLEAEMENLTAALPEQSPEDVKRQAIRKLGDMADRVKQLEAEANKDSLELTKDLLRQMRPMPNAFSKPLEQALAKGDFATARNLIREFQNQLAQGGMTPEQREALSKQLEELAKQLAQLAEQNKALEEMLEKQGLDKKLAQLSADDLRKALEKRGLTPEQIEPLLQKFSACKSACSKCSGLASALAACSGGAMGADALGELAGQLGDLEAFEQRMALLEASLAEIQNAAQCLGKGMCMSPGGKSPFGNSSVGLGHLPDQNTEETDGPEPTKATKVSSTQRAKQAVASWYFKGEQIRGESSQELEQTLVTAQEKAAEAIQEHEIPRRYEESVKRYFGGLEEQVQE